MAALPEDLRGRLQAVCPLLSALPESAPRPLARQRAVPFYRSAVWWEVTPAGPDQRPLRFVDDGHGAVWLDGSRTSIDAANKRFAIALTAADIPAYVHFFFYHVGNGALQVVADATAVDRLLAPIAHDRQRHAVLTQHLCPPRIAEILVDGWRVVVSGRWHDLFVILHLKVRPDGDLMPLSQVPL